MIGGIDLVIPTRAGATALDVCVRAIRREWPDAVFEDAHTGMISDSYERLAFAGLSELFVYRDGAAARAWEEKGAVPSLENTMIHILASSTELTLVVDNPTSLTMSRLLASIHRGLRTDILNIPAQVKEAA